MENKPASHPLSEATSAEDSKATQCSPEGHPIRILSTHTLVSIGPDPRKVARREIAKRVYLLYFPASYAGTADLEEFENRVKEYWTEAFPMEDPDDRLKSHIQLLDAIRDASAAVEMEKKLHLEPGYSAPTSDVYLYKDHMRWRTMLTRAMLDWTPPLSISPKVTVGPSTAPLQPDPAALERQRLWASNRWIDELIDYFHEDPEEQELAMTLRYP